MKAKSLFQIFAQPLYGTIFVDANADFVHFIHENDGNFRSEYMNEILKFFGGKMIVLDVDDSEVSEEVDSPKDWLKIMQPAIKKVLAKVKK